MDKNLENIKKYFRATNYLSASQIFLQDNYLMERPLKTDDIKKRLLGHWGTCPGINFVYTHLNYLVKKHNIDMMYVVGPGHGFPAVQSNLFLEGTLSKYYPNITLDEKGIEEIVNKFSWPFGYPSHASPGAPGVILEGGELGYSLSTSYGAVLDNPDLIVTCLVGDGEAETGPISAAWHLNKLVDPSINGAVLPILHLNGYKISGPTILARMDDDELKELFTGYGYTPHFIETDGSEEDEDRVHQEMIDLMEKCYSEIRSIQEKARAGEEVEKPHFPMIVMRTPKGWTGIESVKGKKVEGNHYSHQVVTKNARIDEEEKNALEEWLLSYKFEELFDKDSGFISEISEILPEEKYRIGNNKHAFGGPEVYTPLELPEASSYEEDASVPGTVGSSSMRRIGEFLNDVFKLNDEEKNFRLFSPDETYSNKLDKVFETTSRSFVWPKKEWDEDISKDGRVIEMLSEHSLQGLIQGYVLTGRHGIFASYEAFIQIVVSMCDQYAKFLKQSQEIKWRGTIPSLNYILTSSGWRQDHNGFSHQNPGFIDNVLQRQGDFINVYLPADGNTALAVIEKCLKDTNGINVIVAGKTVEPRWISVAEAKQNLDEGVAIWKFASDENPDIVFASAGDYPTKEALAAVDLLKKKLPEIKVRFVNVSSLSYTGFGSSENVLKKEDFHNYFTKDKPVIFNYHGYPQTIKQILFDYAEHPDRFEVRGYIEEGSTTSPFDMQVRNKTDRFNLVKQAAEFLSEQSTISESKKDEIIKECDESLSEHHEYIKKHGVDIPEIEDWTWGK
jgi:xylulose-5-phosphate/fructose-6-phosphate phosphoketolase